MHEVGSEQVETEGTVKAKFEHFAKVRKPLAACLCKYILGHRIGASSLSSFAPPKVFETIVRMLVADGNLDVQVEKAISGVCLHFIRAIYMFQKWMMCLMLYKGTLSTIVYVEQWTWWMKMKMQNTSSWFKVNLK